VSLLAGCIGQRRDGEETARQLRKPACVVVVLDPTVGPNSRKGYAEDFAKVVDSLEAGDVLLGGAISDITEQTFRFEISADIPKFNLMKDSNVQYAAKIAAIRKQQKDTAWRLLSTRPTNSDIIGGFLEAAKAFSGEKGRSYERRILIVFSDGIEQNTRHNFARSGELTGEKVAKVISGEKGLGRLAELDGVEVYMVGVYSGPDPKANITQEKMADIRRFWAEYTKEAGACLDSTNYGPSLVNFRLH
jgi:hypothetical protein